MERSAGWRAVAMAAVLAYVASACTGGEPRPAPPAVADQLGGTLRVGLAQFVPARSNFLDPQAPFSVAGAGQREILRCCLARTLLSYTGRPTADGGTILHPDLATALPEISDDALTWTFRLKEGIRYAPPLEDVEITATDIVRALERTATPAIATQEYVTVFEPIG